MTTDVALPAEPVARPDRLGQGTAIEQSRAVAQVQAAVFIARQYPRDVQAAIRAMKEACARPALANRAFYEYKRAGQAVTGSTIKLAQELARIWGNVDFGLHELRLDPVAGESEMLAYAWDLESNSRFSQIVIVRHVRDKKVDGVKVAEHVTDQRDVYELNTSNAARRLRECIRRVVPDWFFEEAEARCRKTIEEPGDGLTLPQRIAQLLHGFESRWGVDVARVEARVGKPNAAWTSWDVAQLQIAGDSIVRGEIGVDEAFPVAQVTSAEIIGQVAAAPVAQPEPASRQEPPADDTAPDVAMVDRGQLTRIHTILTNCGVTDRVEKLATVGQIVRRSIESSNELTHDEAQHVIKTLSRVTNDADPAAALDHYLANLDQETA